MRLLIFDVISASALPSWCSHHPIAGDASDEELLMDLLLELPDQHSEYCRMRGVMDNTPGDGVGEGIVM